MLKLTLLFLHVIFKSRIILVNKCGRTWKHLLINGMFGLSLEPHQENYCTGLCKEISLRKVFYRVALQLWFFLYIFAYHIYTHTRVYTFQLTNAYLIQTLFYHIPLPLKHLSQFLSKLTLEVCKIAWTKKLFQLRLNYLMTLNSIFILLQWP